MGSEADVAAACNLDATCSGYDYAVGFGGFGFLCTQTEYPGEGQADPDYKLCGKTTTTITTTTPEYICTTGLKCGSINGGDVAGSEADVAAACNLDATCSDNDYAV